MLRRWLALLGIALLVIPSVLSAQRGISVTLQTGPAFPTKSLSGVDLDTGFGFEGTIGYDVRPHLAVYAGWGWHRITTADFATPFVDRAADVKQTGFVFGVRFDHPFELGSLRPSVVARAGGTLEQLETKNWDGEVTEDSGHGLGGEFGVGVGFGLAPRWSITPGVRFRWLRRDVTIDGFTRQARLDYLAFEIGGTYRF